MKVQKLIDELQALGKPDLDVVVQIDCDNVPGSYRFAFGVNPCHNDSDRGITDKEDWEEDAYPGDNCVVIGI